MAYRVALQSCPEAHLSLHHQVGRNGYLADLNGLPEAWIGSLEVWHDFPVEQKNSLEEQNDFQAAQSLEEISS